jgi:RNA polymerase sigma-70 factor (ECF subfamily)
VTVPPAEDRDLAHVLAEHGGLLSRIAATYEARPIQREDLLQEIAVAIWRALPRFREEASIRTFVARIAHNRSVDHVLTQRRDGRVIDLDEQIADTRPCPEEETTSRQDRARLLAAVHRLPIALRQVVSLALEGFSHGEIASVLGLEVNTVDVRLSRARRALREALGGTS